MSYPLPEVIARVNEVLIKRLNHPGHSIKNTTWLQLTNFTLTPIKLGRVISDQVINKYGLGRHLIDFFVPNKDLPPRSGKLTTIGPEVTNIGIK